MTLIRDLFPRGRLVSLRWELAALWWFHQLLVCASLFMFSKFSVSCWKREPSHINRGRGSDIQRSFPPAHANLLAHTKCKHIFHHFQCCSQHKLIAAALLTDAAEISKVWRKKSEPACHKKRSQGIYKNPPQLTSLMIAWNVLKATVQK